MTFWSETYGQFMKPVLGFLAMVAFVRPSYLFCFPSGRHYDYLGGGGLGIAWRLLRGYGVLRRIDLLKNQKQYS